MLAGSVLVTERRRVPLLEARCCRAARRAAAWAGDCRADRPPFGMLLLRVGERCCVLPSGSHTAAGERRLPQVGGACHKSAAPAHVYMKVLVTRPVLPFIISPRRV